MEILLGKIWNIENEKNVAFTKDFLPEKNCFLTDNLLFRKIFRIRKKSTSEESFKKLIKKENEIMNFFKKNNHQDVLKKIYLFHKKSCL